jgi:hypothetical protein
MFDPKATASHLDSTTPGRTRSEDNGPALPRTTDAIAIYQEVRVGPEASQARLFALSHPAPHPHDIIVISRAELAAHLGFLEGDVDPTNSSEDGKGAR